MVRNKALDNLKVEHIDKIEPIDEQEPVSDDIIGKILSDIGYNRLVQEILCLDVIYRDVLTLKLIYEYSIDEICSWLNISENTEKSRIYRGRKMLRERLGGFYNEK